MIGLDRTLLAEKSAAVHRHLARVEERLPQDVEGLESSSEAADAVVLHLWQAAQLAIDLALTACAGTETNGPATYLDAFAGLAEAGRIQPDLARRLGALAGFPEAVMHAFEDLDPKRTYGLAAQAPADLRAFLAALRDLPELAE